MFPQFSAVVSSAKSLKARCEMCIPFQQWSTTHKRQFPRLKSTKFATTEQIAKGEGFLEFEGMTQITVHSKSRYHQAAVTWFQKKEEEDIPDTCPPSTAKLLTGVQQSITAYLKPKQNTSPLN